MAVSITWNSNGESRLHPHEREAILRDGPPFPCAQGTVHLDSKAPVDGNGNLWLVPREEASKPVLVGTVTGIERRRQPGRAVPVRQLQPQEPVEVLLEEMTADD